MSEEKPAFYTEKYAAVDEGPNLPKYYSMKVPLLASGRRDYLMVQSDQLWAHVKVYASGGENDLHSHDTEDHTFVVLAGEATFFDEEGTARVVHPHEGAFIPRGVKYRFLSSSAEPLVMFRAGAGVRVPYSQIPLRKDPDGKPRSAFDDPAGSAPIVEIPGRVFGDGL
jgi:mannose-6-phosphate isomerase-like protein (cupin superfamily)